MGSLRFLGSLVLIGGMAGIVAPTACSMLAQQASTQPAAMTRLVGAVVSVKGQSLTVKPDSGPPTTVTVADSARILQTMPGAKTIAGATPIHLTDLTVGDRVLVAVRPARGWIGSDRNNSDRHARGRYCQRAPWPKRQTGQKRGVGGIVKTVDTAAGTVTIAHQNTTVTIHTTPKTVVRHV